MVVIIGSGPAGHTAAIYAARASLEPLMFEGAGGDAGIPGGQLMITNDVENYPGFPARITGPALMASLREQSLRQGVEIRAESVTQVNLGRRPFAIHVGDRITHADAVIIATGAQAKWLGLPNELALRGKGVSACAVCDGPLFRGDEVLVVGGGDTAMEEATYLAGIAAKVTLVHRKRELRASQTMQARVLGNPKIDIVYNARIGELLAHDGGVTGAVLVDVSTEMSWEVPATGVFVAIGHTPNSALFAEYLELHPNGYIKTRPGTTQTSVSGVFAAGDVQDFVYRQAITAAGSGCMAALEAERWLRARERDTVARNAL
jgi:thioredoxin reductase (NADPH)